MLDPHLESAGLDAETAFDVVRGLGLQPEVTGNRIEEGWWAESRPGRNAFVDIRRSERAGSAAEHREYVIEAMLDANMQRVLCFAAIQRKGLSAAIKKRRKRAVGS